jgi:16S rRNA (cytosine1402-N4)-methyltransferase
MSGMENKLHKISGAADLSSGPGGEAAYHTPVLLHEAIEGLAIRADGAYVDCTFGGGGHARAILARLGPAGRLFLFDQDADAKAQVPEDRRVVFLAHNFRHLQRFLRLHGAVPVDGILADLGVSSHQFDQPERGFSTRQEGNLDMRMDKRQKLTAYEVLQTYSEQRLHKIFEQYGEVTNAKTLAKKILAVRAQQSLKTTSAFQRALADVVKGNPHRYFAQVFQALRIEVNEELAVLQEMLSQVPSVLRQGGRVVIITFHSLEDRIVKNFFKTGSFDQQEVPNPFPHNRVAKTFNLINKKPIVPSAEELKRNPRSRSAKLRIAELLTSGGPGQ